MLTHADNANWDTIQAAFKCGRVALLECQEAATGLTVGVIVALDRDDHGEIAFVPLAKMFTGNPYDELRPPDPLDPDGGFYDS